MRDPHVKVLYEMRPARETRCARELPCSTVAMKQRDPAPASAYRRIARFLADRVQPYNLIVSNVPGPQLPLYVLGARLLELYPMAPLFERQGLGVAVMSYHGRLCWGLTADRDLAPDLPAMAEDLDAALAELLEAAPEGVEEAQAGREAPSS